MTLIVKNTTIPTDGDYVYFNGTNLDQVDVVKNSSRVTVWKKEIYTGPIKSIYGDCYSIWNHDYYLTTTRINGITYSLDEENNTGYKGYINGYPPNQNGGLYTIDFVFSVRVYFRTKVTSIEYDATIDLSGSWGSTFPSNFTWDVNGTTSMGNGTVHDSVWDPVHGGWDMYDIEISSTINCSNMTTFWFEAYISDITAS